MLRVNYQIEYGSVKVKNNDKTKVLTVKIHQANALCAFIYHYQREDGQRMAQLWSFLCDLNHAKRLIKNTSDHTLLGTSVVSVKLNVYYKEARQLIMPMAQSGYKVTVYYKEPKKK
jgi:hypothetical protein